MHISLNKKYTISVHFKLIIALNHIPRINAQIFTLPCTFEVFNHCKSHIRDNAHIFKQKVRQQWTYKSHTRDNAHIFK